MLKPGIFVFQSTRPVRGGTYDSAAAIVERLFQSTRPVRGGTTHTPSSRNRSRISIHPPRAGRDFAQPYRDYNGGISIHPPRAGRDNIPTPKGIPTPISIHPPRAGRDCNYRRILCQYANFNPPAPCGAGPAKPALSLKSMRFQSTRPVRGGTRRHQRVR